MKTYLFDFDGTLVDSMPTFASVMLRILKESNIAFVTAVGFCFITYSVSERFFLAVPRKTVP